MNLHHKSRRHTILDTIRQHGRIARIDLAQATGISQATVTTLTAQMLTLGLIAEYTTEDKQDSGARRGRPRVDLMIRGDAYLVVGIKLAYKAVSIVFMDFAGTLKGEYTAALSMPVIPPDTLCKELKKIITAAAADNNLDPSGISAIGIGLAGTVDTARGFVHWSPTLTERNVPLQTMLSETLGRPAYVDNDANLVAMAEMLFGHGVDVSDFIVVTIEEGVGMGIVLNNALYRGARGCGAEFGHTKVQLDGALCRCGQRGCLEAYVADYALLREASVSGYFDDASPRDINAVFNAANTGEAAAQSILARAARMLTMGLANVINIFDPPLIILAGARMQHDYLYTEVATAVRNQIVQVDSAQPRVVLHNWGDQMWAKGAAAYALDCMTDRSLRNSDDNAA